MNGRVLPRIAAVALEKRTNDAVTSRRLLQLNKKRTTVVASLLVVLRMRAVAVRHVAALPATAESNQRLARLRRHLLNVCPYSSKSNLNQTVASAKDPQRTSASSLMTSNRTRNRALVHNLIHALLICVVDELRLQGRGQQERVENHANEHAQCDADAQ
eukprot:6181255-Pleurochrysis_carterae.AAC.3